MKEMEVNTFLLQLFIQNVQIARPKVQLFLCLKRHMFEKMRVCSSILTPLSVNIRYRSASFLKNDLLYVHSQKKPAETAGFYFSTINYAFSTVFTGCLCFFRFTTKSS